jgi:hypothetical protein
MRKPFGLLMIAATTALVSCNPAISTSIVKSYSPLDFKQDVTVYGLNEPQPNNAEVIGVVKVGDTGFTTNCSYDVVMDKAKLEARKAGGNALKITEHKVPTAMGSTCHRIKATILKVENIETLRVCALEPIDTTADYATLNIYRYGGYGAIIGYDIHLGDSIICRAKNNFKTTLQIKKEGLNSLWASTESKAEVPIEIKMGRTYYLRCGIAMGVAIGRPTLELIDSKTGKIEFESFNAKNQ